MAAEDPLSPKMVLAQAERILGSTYFSRSPSLSRLLRFIVQATIDGQQDEVKEYRLGVDVFDRGTDFDPSIDPVVRVQAAKLRSRLTEYYATDGQADPVLIAVPKGAYVATFEPAAGARAAAEPSTGVQSIAVLPFVSMSSDSEDEYFSDGLTEELINELTHVPGLQVVARTSAFCFKNSPKDIREIEALLNVKTVLEGSVRRSGDRLRVTAQLIDVATGFHLLSRTFRAI